MPSPGSAYLYRRLQAAEQAPRLAEPRCFIQRCFIQVVTGPRQVGKSTLVAQAVQTLHGRAEHRQQGIVAFEPW
jgi:predicted AAA+ superfamily ATPase